MSQTSVKKVILVLVFALTMAVGGTQLYRHRHYQVPIVAGPGVTRVAMLSDYLPSLKDTFFDTNVYFLEGSADGSTVLLMGGTHSNEIAGVLAASIFVETAEVDAGTLIVIPNFNNSGGRNTRSGDGYPLYYQIETPWGEKVMRVGNRDASPLDQWPDPDVYIHYPTKQTLSYADIRNTNRTWPGRPNGVGTEQITFAAMELMRTEGVDIAFDLHGAETMYPVTNCIVTPSSGTRIATMTALTIGVMEGFDIHVEPSPEGFRGLSHREIGDHSDVVPFLLEAPIPFLDQPTGPKTVDLLLSGRDPFLLSLSKKQLLFVHYDETGWPIENRVGQHTSTVLEVINQFGTANTERSMIIRGVPQYADILENGVGYYFADPDSVPANRVYYQ
ncbi:MAG: succinylglutamate desuccinylase [Limnochordia bacterium]|jgi:hypothetical protein